MFCCLDVKSGRGWWSARYDGPANAQVHSILSGGESVCEFFFGHVGRILEYIASIDECLFALFPGTTIYGTSESFPHVSSLFLQGFEV